MGEFNYADKLVEAIMDKQSYLCVGLDPQLRYFPPHLLEWAAESFEPGFPATAKAIIAFNIAIINATQKYAACYKPQMAFYEQYGHEGVRAFEVTVEYLKAMRLKVIEDAKREDGGDTADAYADGHLGEVDVIGEGGELVKAVSPYNVDAMTVTPWICDPNFKSFLRVSDSHGKGFFVVDDTSFKPASYLQNLIDKDSGLPAWQVLAKEVAKMGEPLRGMHGYSSVGVVMGATYPEEADDMRKIIPFCFKLVPGFGYQGGGAEDAVVAINEDGLGIIVNQSRSVDYYWHPKIREKLKLPDKVDPRNFVLAAAEGAKFGRDALNKAVKKRIGKLPWE